MKDSHIILITWIGAMVCALLLVTNLAQSSGELARAHHKRAIPADLEQALDSSAGQTPAVEVQTVEEPATETERVDLLLERMDEMDLLQRDVLDLPHKSSTGNTR